jgi:hypothetical protein
MVKTVNEGFVEFLERLTPSEVDTDVAKKHRASIADCLKANFGMTKFFRTGSFGNGTSISGYSDIDYFAVIPIKNLTQNAQSTLSKVKQVLSNRFPSTNVHVRTPAVCVNFGMGEETNEIVPADYLSHVDSYGGFDIYDIPDLDGRWQRSSPDKHNGWVTQVNKRLSLKVKPLIRFVKAWKYIMKVPVGSFYLELRVTKYASEQESIIYSYDIPYFFKYLLDCNLAAIQDPMGVSGLVQPCTESQKEDALSKLTTALARANKALEAERSEKINDAFYWWNMLYDQKFPKYY